MIVISFTTVSWKILHLGLLEKPWQLTSLLLSVVHWVPIMPSLLYMFLVKHRVFNAKTDQLSVLNFSEEEWTFFHGKVLIRSYLICTEGREL